MLVDWSAISVHRESHPCRLSYTHANLLYMFLHHCHTDTQAEMTLARALDITVYRVDVP